VHEGLPVSEAISHSDIDDDAYLKPVLDDDAVIIGLFDLPELTPVPEAQNADNAALVSDLLKRNAELEEQLAGVVLQYENYRAAVSKTLDERWGETATDDGGEKLELEKTAGKGKGKDVAEPREDESKYYWESYAGVGEYNPMIKRS